MGNKYANLARLGIRALNRYPKPQISKLNFVLTMRCNHRCQSCNIWCKPPVMGDLDIADFYKTLEINPSIMWVSLTGGEPSLHPDFGTFISLGLEMTGLVNIITNGELPNRIIQSVDRAFQASAKRSSLLVVHITLFGEPDIHNAMTGAPNSYAHVMETVKGLKELPYQDRLVIGFEHMLSPRNINEHKFAQYRANRSDIGITYTLEQEAGYYANKNGGSPEITIPKLSMTLNPIDLFKNSFLLNFKKKAGCVAGEYSAWMLPGGLVYPCFFSIPDKVAFKASDTGFQLSPCYFKESQDWIRKCRGCWTPCESYTMMVFRPWRLLK